MRENLNIGNNVITQQALLKRYARNQVRFALAIISANSAILVG